VRQYLVWTLSPLSLRRGSLWLGGAGHVGPAGALRALLGVGALLALSLVAGCTPKIGDACTQSTDCSTQGNRVCDTAELGGYCTIFDCARNSCPDMASCVVFNVSVPGCAYDDYLAPERTGRSLCMARCESNSDCRGGYECVDPRQPPFSAVILDDTQQRVCVESPAVSILADGSVVSETQSMANYDAQVCTGQLPFPSNDAGGD
jgi:hypothetical protein